MKQGDIVIVRDSKSDLYLKKGEVLAISKSLVLIYFEMGKRRFIADVFSKHKISKHKFQLT